MNIRHFGLIACLAGTLSVAAWAGPSYEFAIDPVHSSVTFKILHRNVHYAYGRFTDLGGKVVTDNRKAPKEVLITASVEAKSIDTAAKKRDKDLRGKGFFHVRKSKEISFVTKKCKPLKDDKFELSGDLTLLGKTNPLTVEFALIGMGREKLTYFIGGETTFVVKMSDFGMPEHEGLADEVTVTVSLYASYDIPPAG